ncbi:hypothetical protein A3C37_03225 [Candidatus Peribacteria bacterium RIFCSPHIGHO2_02_FULL_53_20]|nr:MAG: hypothetical protein A3C37_03225 [Candidatus Peribacteria bacterium RIFCSPHIGHO2_02_FULL_53_20]OGJ67416.1 MAG: hypothetical protein A3B61_00605 [Candidatus Peribacteria bacterium RIFCSPLOWO2_01_FULL_53_10]OGJ72606.1 MAG: hypothetical protein A3G69_01660 [Candidatus Peribacteria bacterium RIFCSPLOWO2_12_FULL_53_10]
MPLSFTQLASYRRCPRQYEYCTIKKIPKGISLGAAFGALMLWIVYSSMTSPLNPFASSRKNFCTSAAVTGVTRCGTIVSQQKHEKCPAVFGNPQCGEMFFQ